MPFRAKMKRALGGGSASMEYDPANPLTQVPSKKSRKDKEQYPDNVYKPGEPMPRPKYRGPYNQAHQDKLSAFSFGEAWRKRKSSIGTERSGKGVSEYSPMGSKLPSRGPSRRGSAWSAFSGKAGKRGLSSRQGSYSGYDGYDGDVGMVEESKHGDDDVMNGMPSILPFLSTMVYDGTLIRSGSVQSVSQGSTQPTMRDRRRPRRRITRCG